MGFVKWDLSSYETLIVAWETITNTCKTTRSRGLPVPLLLLFLRLLRPKGANYSFPGFLRYPRATYYFLSKTQI